MKVQRQWVRHDWKFWWIGWVLISIECKNDDDENAERTTTTKNIASEYCAVHSDEQYKIIYNFMHKMVLCSGRFSTVN